MTAKTLKNDALLLLAAAIWGFAFVAQRAGMEHVGPFLFNAVRFALGSFVLVPILAWTHTRPHGQPDCAAGLSVRSVAFGGLLAGLVLFVGASFQQAGLVYTTAGKAGFVTGLYVIIVPVFGLFRRHRPGPGTWFGAGCAVVGLYLLSVTGRFGISLGDSLVLASAVFWAVHVLVIAEFSPRIGAIRLAFMQFAICAVLSFAVALFVEEIMLPNLLRAAVPILYAGCLSVGIAYTLQVVAQKVAPPTHTAILLSLEAVFAALGGWMILDERLSARGLLGCALMFAGVLLSQISESAALRRATGRAP